MLNRKEPERYKGNLYLHLRFPTKKECLINQRKLFEVNTITLYLNINLTFKLQCLRVKKKTNYFKNKCKESMMLRECFIVVF